MIKDKIALIISCEHATNSIPDEYKYLFKDHKKILASHEGYDIGAKEISKIFIKELKPDYFFIAEYSRFFIELNRSLHHKNLFSLITKTLNKEEKKQIIEKYYQPYRNSIINKIDSLIKDSFYVLHISVHSFTPVFKNNPRFLDIGFLYNPKNNNEKEFCHQWKNKLNIINPSLKIRMNHPYRGNSDGLTTSLRRLYPTYYSGIEVEINQKWLIDFSKDTNRLVLDLISSFPYQK